MSYNEWLDIDVLEDYLDGRLDAKAMHRVEKLSLEDPFVAEALAGLSQSPKRAQALSLLQKQLQQRIALKPIEKKRWAITSQRLSVAAAAAVLFIAVSILFWMKANKRQEMLANNGLKKVDVTVAPQVATKQTEVKAADENKVAADQFPSPNISVKKTDAKKELMKEAPVVVTNVKPYEALPAPASANVPVAMSMEVAKEKAEVLENASLAKARKVESRGAIAILPSKADGVKPSYFTGKVISKENGMPIPGAIVRVEGINKSMATDKNGEFAILVDTMQNQKLTVGYLGYTTTEIGAKSNQPVNILLENDNSSLKKAVVIAASKTNATPLGGWENYQAYLKANNKLAGIATVKQEVELEFKIRKDSSVTAIQVIKSAGKENDREAIRLLKDGPKWIFVSNAKNVGTLKISF